MNYPQLLQQAIDLHIHIGPEIIPRKFTLPELLKYEEGKLRGVGIKNHFFPTVGTNCVNISTDDPFVINSVTLNSYVGGFNPDIIRASAELSSKPIIVWFPTLHTKQFLGRQQFEIPKEWLSLEVQKQIKLQPAKDINALSIFNSQGKISKEVGDVLHTIKKYGAILATGHISWEESYALVKFAIEKINLKKVIITHPIYQFINMPVAIQKKLVKMGALIEHCFSMYSIDNIPIAKITQQIQEVGANNCILSSDVGQTFSKSPSEALTDFILLLEREGITEEEIKTMLIDNPNKLIN